MESTSFFEIPEELKNFQFPESTLKPEKLIDDMLKEHELIYKNGNFYVYESGRWQESSLEQIMEQLHYRFKKNSLKTTSGAKKAGVDYLSVEANVKDTVSDKYIAFENGIYEIAKDTFYPSSEETKNLFITNILNTEYIEGAECPRWMQFVDEVFEGDEDAEDKTKLLQEFLGYCLTHNISIQKSLILYGSGANGKSISQQILQHILTERNYCAITLENISKESYLAQLVGKTVNIISEVDPKMKNPTQVIKRLTGGDKMTARLLYHNPISFQNKAKLLFALNELPFTNDHTNGFYRRLVILTFNNQFTGEKADPNLLEKLIAEKEGIVQWMLVGLKRLMKNGELTTPESSYKTLEAYKQIVNPVHLFINEVCSLEETAYCTYKELYENFINFCKDYRIKPLPRLEFKKKLRKIHPEIGFKPKNCEGKTIRCFIGIKYVGEEEIRMAA